MKSTSFHFRPISSLLRIPVKASIMIIPFSLVPNSLNNLRNFGGIENYRSPASLGRLTNRSDWVFVGYLEPDCMREYSRHYVPCALSVLQGCGVHAKVADHP
jgi:hypothetical protein